MALLEHKPGDVSVKIIRKENDKFKRGVREAINIKKHKPTLNKDLQDRFYLQPIYDNIIKPEDLKRNRNRNRRNICPGECNTPGSSHSRVN